MKVLLFDDHKLFAKSLEIVMAGHIDEFVCFQTPENIVEIVQQEKPDLLLLDIHMGAYSGLDVCREVLYHYPELKVAFLSGYNLHEYHLEAKRMGAKGFLDKNMSVENLIDNIKQLHQGDTIFMENKAEDVMEELTPREKEILQYASNGDTQQVIADKLGISRRTVNNHLMSINDKLMVNSTVAAIVRGIELGIIKLSNNR
ncbi:DNA-binding response regulator [Paenibacillus sambharensis]|uniref:DNA-binding response regulator n=1 Tax=Paenibacillus sambharensis TaxID=1803190 RepID=A0A2W1L1H7_9BACL|nr:response regulator transcription factor [Paenibacillus sambharensis]PZD92903.1 DNA-binding response regulator [Paenibacillus sambharensis]